MEERSGGGGGGDRERNERVKNAAPSEECPQTRSRAGPNTDSLSLSRLFNGDGKKMQVMELALLELSYAVQQHLQSQSPGVFTFRMSQATLLTVMFTGSSQH